MSKYGLLYKTFRFTECLEIKYSQWKISVFATVINIKGTLRAYLL
jgi:hypothetical protein